MPVKQAIRCYAEKPRPSRVMETGVRAIDTFNPMAEGGTGFIPGPFGAGKTVLQHAISKQADADVIIMVACGERANEVVEIFKEFPERSIEVGISEQNAVSLCAAMARQGLLPVLVIMTVLSLAARLAGYGSALGGLVASLSS